MAESKKDHITRLLSCVGLAANAGLLREMQVETINGIPVTGAIMAAELLKAANGDVIIDVIVPEHKLPVAYLPKPHCKTIHLQGICLFVACNYMIIIPNSSWASVILCHALIGLFCWGLFRTQCTHPGLVPANWLEHAAPSSTPHFLCDRSGLRLPLRAQFVARTGEAYLLFDHYCFWLGAPIGLRNRRHFVLFLTYGTMLCAYGSIATGKAGLLLHHTRDPLTVVGISLAKRLWHARDSTELRVLAYLFMSIFDVIATIILGIFAGYHWYMAARNRTSLSSGNTYDLGSMKLNLENIFGRPSWAWVLPLQHGGPRIDGLWWPSVPTVEQSKAD